MFFPHALFRTMIRPAATLAVLAGAAPARGQDVNWINGTGGSFTLGVNWQGGAPPGPAATAVFGVAAGTPIVAYTVTVPNGVPDPLEVFALRVEANWVTLDLSEFNFGTRNVSLAAPADGPTPSLRIGTGAGPSTRLTLLNTSALDQFLAGGDASVGEAAGSLAEFVVRGQYTIATFAGDLDVGIDGIGTVTLDQRARMSARTLRLGSGSGGSGTLRVYGLSGQASTLTYAGAGRDLLVGDSGVGSIEIASGGALSGGTSSSIVLGSALDSAGSVAIVGAGSSWAAAATDFFIGDYGSASISVSAGGLLQSATSNPVVIGRQFGSTAQVFVGSGGTWNETSQSILVGGTGVGFLDVGSGGTVSVPPSRLVRISDFGAELRGGGTLIADTVCLGVLAPSAASEPPVYAGLTITRSLTMTGINDEFEPVGGRIQLAVQGELSTPGTHDSVTVTGTASLGGTLVVRLPANSAPNPPDDLAIPLISANAYDPAHPYFDVAYLPRLSGGKFYRVNYPGGPGDVTLGIGNFGGGPAFGGSTLGTTVSAAVTAAGRGDLDSDGFDDLAIATSDGSLFIFFNNDGDGTFSQIIQLPVGAAPAGVKIIDLDPDNPNANGLDIIVTNSGSDNATVYSRTAANGTWFIAATPALGSSPRGLCALDFDKDSNIDFAVANAGSNTVSFVRGNSRSSISFQSQISLATDDEPVDVDPWDPDNPKGTSMVVSAHSGNGGDGSMSFLRNSGGSSFEAPVNFGVGQGPFALAAADFNLDGLADVVTLNDGGTASMLLSDGAGGFRPAASIAVGAEPRSLATADLDLDGDTDVLLIAQNDAMTQTVKFVRNDTSTTDNALTLAFPEDVPTANPPEVVLAGRVDSDSRPDIIAITAGLRSQSSVFISANGSFCPSDFDQNGFVNGDDFDSFAIAFDAGDPSADFDHNGFVNGDDTDAFAVAFDSGC